MNSPGGSPSKRTWDSQFERRLYGSVSDSSGGDNADPYSSPARSRRRAMEADRFITDRTGMDLSDRFDLYVDPKRARRTEGADATAKDIAREEATKYYSTLLTSQMFGDQSGMDEATPTLFDYSPRRRRADPNAPPLQVSSLTGQPLVSALSDSPLRGVYSHSPIKQDSQRLLSAPRTPPRHIPKVPIKILDAPMLQDDFYLNLLDWSSQDVVAVGLSQSVYLWNAENSNVQLLCTQRYNTSCVSWSPLGNQLAVASDHGQVGVWDVQRETRLLDLPEPASSPNMRIGCLAWHGPSVVTTGGRDHRIALFDLRSRETIRVLQGHTQEVCGLRWSPDGRQLGSGGNDNKVFVWDERGSTYLHRFTDHVAAVKALAWSPHQTGLLASAGGATDRRIRFWNTLTGTCLSSVDTGSQVCNLAWSQTANEIVSTHGFTQNQIIVWRYPSMLPLATLTGHTSRVLYLATSPNCETIMTGAGDETLRLWRVFEKPPATGTPRGSMTPFTQIR